MTLTTTLKKAGQIAGALLVVGGLLVAGGVRPAAADRLCEIYDVEVGNDRGEGDFLCYPKLEYSNGAITARWNGSSMEKYNVIWDKWVSGGWQRVGGQVSDLRTTQHSIRVSQADEHRTFRFSVQGCNEDWAGYSDCTSNPKWLTGEIVPVPVSQPVPPAPAPAPAPLPEKPATPSNFRGQYQNGFGTRIFLDWNDTSTETYYYLTAHSVVGDVPQRLADPAPKLGAGSTTFIVTGDLTALVGGIEFRLQACNPGGCSPQAKVVVK